MNSCALEFTKFYSQFFSIGHTTLKAPRKINVLILAPHPDDECLMAPYALRLLLENKANVHAASVTLGSNSARQGERQIEFHNACQVMNFTSHILSLEWDKKAEEVKDIIKREEINFIVSPHVHDHHPAHIKTGELARKVMKEISFEGIYLESEFWGELTAPNLLIEVTKEAFELSFEALTKHVGEVSRNPYHLRLAANLVNSVRRGAEKVATLGSSAPNFAFGVLYQAHHVQKGSLTALPNQTLDSTADLGAIFEAAN
jgi:LmbE family N-acetylglucosaminyl deacetylase